MGGIQAAVLDTHHPVHQDDRNARVPGLLEHRVPARLLDGHQDNIVHLLLDEPADGGDLVLLLLPGVLKEEAVAGLLGEH